VLAGPERRETAVAPVRDPFETHLPRLFERFAIASRTELATRALREGWLEIPAS
jgi:hypothetical protein